MAKIPKPRKPGQTGGSVHNKVNRSTHASARVTQKGKKSLGSGCLSLIIVVTLITGTVGGVAALLV